MSADDWRVDMGRGMALQQLSRMKTARAGDPLKPVSAETKAKLEAEAGDHRRDARLALDRAGRAAGENAPADIPFHLALLDLEEGRSTEFVAHAEDAFSRLEEAEKVLRAQLKQPMAQSLRDRTEADRAIAAERGQRLCRELAIVSWNAGDFGKAAAAMTRLEQFGALGRADYFSRGAVREKLGDDEAAVQDYEKFLDLSGDAIDETVGKAVTALTRVRARLAEKRTASPAGGS
jgi:tetratricopeptide (TPR) repeat protein